MKKEYIETIEKAIEKDDHTMKLLLIIKNKQTKKIRIVDLSDYVLIDCVTIFRFWKLLNKFETKIKLINSNSHLYRAYEIQELKESISIQDLNKGN